ncbi:MAG: CoA activase [Armatimonadetes bacterium]|nr:CoA activase [Armatimonadota bacterium]
MSSRKCLLGIDVGSVSVNLAVLDGNKSVIQERYVRHKGRPMKVAAEVLREAISELGIENIAGLAATGAGGRVIAQILGATFTNEVVAQATATSTLHPEVRTVVEIGGEDSKLLYLQPSQSGDHIDIADFAMNSMCAAGTGSFLDQQASRLGLSIEDFGRLALESQTPPRVAGRCSVFAKSDMIHLQQKATPTSDIVAGLCYALVRNFKSTVGSARALEPPVAFQGGVAANPGIVRAMRDVLELTEDQLVIPEHFAAMGAIGAVLKAGDDIAQPDFSRLDELAQYVFHAGSDRTLLPLKLDNAVIMPAEVTRPEPRDGERIPAYLGVDIGSISTNLVVIDADGNVLCKRYLMTAGAPIEAVRTGLREVGQEVGAIVDIRGACTTGSGRYLIADFIGADVVKNEITAQARGALAIDPKVDTIFEIGGQDSKYIRLENGHVVDFEMNKVCAAGTGSFLEEQAEKLGISIKEEFGNLALQAKNPANLGERCTVFMETELQRNQQAGTPTEDLVAGLAYSVVYNYLNRVVARKPVGERIFFQGGTAFNRAVVAAFGMVTGKTITVPAHNEVTGALGCALIAREEDQGKGSRFKGFDLSERKYTIQSFECRECANRCEINKVTVEGERPLFYGSRCEKYDVDRSRRTDIDLPDLFAEREQMLLTAYQPRTELPEDAPRVGIPRALMFHDLFPMWHAMLTELGCRVVLSDPTNKSIIHEGVEKSVVETCFPVKVALGHVLDLLSKDIEYIFLPSVINLPKLDKSMTDSFVCPYGQSFPYTVNSAVDIEAHGVKPLRPVFYLEHGSRQLVPAMTPIAKELGRSEADARRAVDAGIAAQRRFAQLLQVRGKQVLDNLPEDRPSIVIVSRAYNGCDPGANLEIPQKLRHMGVLAIPLDFLPLDNVELPGDWFNMYWRYGQRILAAAEVISQNPKLHALYLTNFSCGPDSFIMRYFQERLGSEPVLMIEVDEHSADAGMITRCEAFLDSLESTKGQVFEKGRTFRPLSIATGSRREMLIPNMSSHAYAVAAAFRACGMPARVMDPPDDETLMWGRKYTSGKECFPCIVTTGDMVREVMRPDFDRDTAAFFMGGSGGPCRFGQYNALQRMVLDDLGYTDVPLYAPNQASGFFDDLGVVGRKFLRLAWRGMVAVDLLDKALMEIRPYEVRPGTTDAVHQVSLEDVTEAVAGNGDLLAALKRSRDRFAAIEIDRSQERPIIGLVGEFYIRANAFSNEDLVRKIEELGGEVWASPIYEWFLYRNFRRDMRAKLAGNLKLRLKNWLMDRVMVSDEHHLIAAFDGLLRNAYEPPTQEVLAMAEPYVHRSFEGEAIMTVGKAVDFARKGLSGVVAVMPFTCMPGTISEALMKRVREDENEIPFLNMVYDGFEQSTARTRLEAFMYQAREYMNRNRAAAAL